ncbi:DUF4013 domain-containing protein [Nanoarchaeota archaeon]
MSYFSAIKKPFIKPDRFIIGCSMYLIPYLNILTQFFAIGYMSRTAKNTMKGIEDLPEWIHWLELLTKGLFVFLIVLLYSIPLFIVLLFGIGNKLFGDLAFSRYINWNDLDLSTYAFIVLSILIFYFLPSAIMNFLKHERFSAAFEFGKIIRDALIREYFITVVISFVYVSIMIILVKNIAVFFSEITVIRLIINSIVQFLVGMTLFSLFSEIYKK